EEEVETLAHRELAALMLLRDLFFAAHLQRPCLAVQELLCEIFQWRRRRGAGRSGDRFRNRRPRSWGCRSAVARRRRGAFVSRGLCVGLGHLAWSSKTAGELTLLTRRSAARPG